VPIPKLKTVKVFGTEILPPRPVHLSATFAEAIFSALLRIVTELSSVSPSGVQVRFILALLPGGTANVLGDIVNTAGLLGAVMLPYSTPPFPEFLMISLADDNELIPIPTGLNVTEFGDEIFAPSGVGVGAGFIVAVPV